MKYLEWNDLEPCTECGTPSKLENGLCLPCSEREPWDQLELPGVDTLERFCPHCMRDCPGGVDPWDVLQALAGRDNAGENLGRIESRFFYPEIHCCPGAWSSAVSELLRLGLLVTRSARRPNELTRLTSVGLSVARLGTRPAEMSNWHRPPPLVTHHAWNSPGSRKKKAMAF